MSLVTKKTPSIREEKKRAIFLAAQKEFDQYSYAGARMQRIADNAGIAKANVHYYYSSKLQLYNEVLENVVMLWDDAFISLDADDDPKTVLSEFVQRKIEFTRLYPEATRIFTSEMLHGAPYLNKQLNQRMSEWTRQRAKVISQWVERGKIKKVDPYHLIFLIWSSTQHFAVCEPQIKSVYRQTSIGRQDYSSQSESLTTMVMRICGLD